MQIGVIKWFVATVWLWKNYVCCPVLIHICRIILVAPLNITAKSHPAKVFIIQSLELQGDCGTWERLSAVAFLDNSNQPFVFWHTFPAFWFPATCLLLPSFCSRRWCLANTPHWMFQMRWGEHEVNFYNCQESDVSGFFVVCNKSLFGLTSWHKNCTNICCRLTVKICSSKLVFHFADESCHRSAK